MQSELRIDINQEVDVVRPSVSSKRLSVSLATSAMICLSRRSTPSTSTWRRYFGQKTTWYLHEKTMLRFDLYPIAGYIAVVYIIIKKAAPCSRDSRRLHAPHPRTFGGEFFGSGYQNHWQICFT